MKINLANEWKMIIMEKYKIFIKIEEYTNQ